MAYKRCFDPEQPRSICVLYCEFHTRYTATPDPELAAEPEIRRSTPVPLRVVRTAEHAVQVREVPEYQEQHGESEDRHEVQRQRRNDRRSECQPGGRVHRRV